MIILMMEHGIRDENGNEQLIFETTASAVNELILQTLQQEIMTFNYLLQVMIQILI